MVDEAEEAAASAAKRGAGVARGRRTLSQRLLSALTGEVRALERAMRAASAAEDAEETGVGIAGGAKARVDAIGSLTRTLEKLLDLARAESAVAKNSADEEGEAERLRGELMKRLRAIDAKRGSGRRLFGTKLVAGAGIA